MANDQELMQALKLADQAGNVEDATKLAGIIASRNPERFQSTVREFPQELQGAASAPPASGTSDAFANATRQSIGLGAAPVPQEGRPSGFMASFKSGFVRDPKTKIKIFANELFPNEPNAEKRFGIVDNQVVYVDNDGTLKKASSGLASSLGGASSNAPEALFATAGSFATGNPVAGSIVGDVGGRAVKQAIGSLVFDEPQTAKENLMDLGKEAGLAAAGGALGKVGTSTLGRRAVKDFDKLKLQSATDVQKRIKKSTGIDLDVAQASGLPGLKQLRKWVMKFPSEAAETMESFAKLQNGQSEEAVEGILNTLSKKTNLQQLGESGINAAKASIELAKQQREEIASPLYKKAFAEGTKVDASSITERIDDLIVASKGDVKSDLIKARSFFKKEPGGFKVTGGTRTEIGSDIEDSISGLHGAKIAIDAMLSKRAGATAAENQSKRHLTQIQKDLVNTLAEASPNYEAGRAAFEKASKELVNPLEESAVGALANLSNDKAARAAANLFSETPNVEAIKFAKRVIKSQDPQAWNDLIRQKLQQELENSMKLTQTGQVVNMQGKFLQSVFGRKSKREALEVALDEELLNTTADVLEAFEFIANSPIGGSDTAFNLAVTEQQKQSGVSLVRKALTPIQSLADMADEAFLQKHSEAIAGALTDPKKLPQIKKLLELPKGQERAIGVVTAVLGGRSGRVLTDRQDDVLPEVLNNTTRQ